MGEQLKPLKEQYENISIPKELDFIVKQAIKQRKTKSAYMKWVIGIAAAIIVCTTTGVNSNPAFAKALSEVPVVGSIVKVLTFKEVVVNEGNAQATFQVPAVTNMTNQSLEAALNSKYVEENKKLYDQFTADVAKLKQNGDGHLGVNSGYTVKTDNEQILAIGRYVVNTVGSSSTTFKYDTIDKKNEVLLTLPSLFKDDRYISLISDNVKEQMKAQMKADDKKVYWVEGVPNQANAAFKNIGPDQNFYINADGKLVISFNKYEVAPGYMGVIEFVIPTEAIADDLVSGVYVK
ncbi:DUF3298 domain-containing protein [Paenibacillus aestuarii]|uniref:DUF3298 domain-containing protein n=1 Tax=Paenibacillus aestuarii TaxID=516965 RepID=A0ABW0K836_9BACL|nr:DUF3298 domain-containing protein [Paenibacillus aestuarii]